VVGAWLAFINYTKMFEPSTLAWNNIILGIVVAVYNAYYLFAKGNVDVKNKS
jgi:hypothetical protein